jgi:hypothetical protein
VPRQQADEHHRLHAPPTPLTLKRAPQPVARQWMRHQGLCAASRQEQAAKGRNGYLFPAACRRSALVPQWGMGATSPATTTGRCGP